MIKYLLILGLLWSCSPSPTSSEIVVEKKYFPSGKIMEIRHLKDGIRTGLQTAFWEMETNDLSILLRTMLTRGS